MYTVRLALGPNTPPNAKPSATAMPMSASRAAAHVPVVLRVDAAVDERTARDVEQGVGHPADERRAGEHDDIRRDAGCDDRDSDRSYAADEPGMLTLGFDVPGSEQRSDHHAGAPQPEHDPVAEFAGVEIVLDEVHERHVDGRGGHHTGHDDHHRATDHPIGQEKPETQAGVGEPMRPRWLRCGRRALESSGEHDGNDGGEGDGVDEQRRPSSPPCDERAAEHGSGRATERRRQLVVTVGGHHSVSAEDGRDECEDRGIDDRSEYSQGVRAGDGQHHIGGDGEADGNQGLERDDNSEHPARVVPIDEYTGERADHGAWNDERSE